jgi:hypothetical protein
MLACSRSISVTVGDTKSSKEIEFTVQQSPQGKTSVAVTHSSFDRRAMDFGAICETLNLRAWSQLDNPSNQTVLKELLQEVPLRAM